MSIEELEAQHRKAYAERYPGSGLGIGSSFRQWFHHVEDTPETRRLYAQGYKPAKARKILREGQSVVKAAEEDIPY